MNLLDNVLKMYFLYVCILISNTLVMCFVKLIIILLYEGLSQSIPKRAYQTVALITRHFLQIHKFVVIIA